MLPARQRGVQCLWQTGARCCAGLPIPADTDRSPFARVLSCRRPTFDTEEEMRYLHTMLRVSNLEQSLDFFCDKLGFVEVRRMENEAGRFTLVYLAAPEDLARSQAEKSDRKSTRLNSSHVKISYA